MQMRHQPATALLPQGEEAGIEIEWLERRKPQTRNGSFFQQRRHQAAQVLPAIAAVSAQMDAGQHRFLVARLVQPIDLRHHLHGRTTTLLTARDRYDAKCTTVVATALNFEKGPGTTEFAVTWLERQYLGVEGFHA